MRGKVFFVYGNGIFPRITPAYAGKSVFEQHDVISDKDHPRLCGEKYQEGTVITAYIGSPPPMRGKGHGLSFSPRFFRITPAYAGKRTKKTM